MAKGFEGVGIRRLHIVDLDGANWQPLKNIKTLENISNSTSLIIDFGGGIKTAEDAQSVFNAGAAMISVGSLTVKDPVLFFQMINQFGAKKFLPGADVLYQKNKNSWMERRYRN